MNETWTRYRVRQTLYFGSGFEEIFRTLPAAEAYARVVAAGIAGVRYMPGLTVLA
jgi:hypothetical protein